MMAGVVTEVSVGVFLFLIGVALLVLVWRKGLQRIEARLGSLSLIVEGIDRAVNNVPPGEPPLVAKVSEIHEVITNQHEVITDQHEPHDTRR